MKPLAHAKPILLGIILFLLVNIAVTVAMGPELNDDLNAKVENILPKKLDLLDNQAGHPIDVLAMGTSQTNNDFDTLAFEKAMPGQLNSFNLGLAGTRYDVMETYLRYHLDHYGKPKLILLEVTDALAENKTVYFYLPALHYHTLLTRDMNLAPYLLKNPLVDGNVKKEVCLSMVSVFYQFRPMFTPTGLLKKGVSAITAAMHTVNRVASPEAQAVPQTEAVLAIPPEWTVKGWSPRQPVPSMSSAQGILKNAASAKTYYLDTISGISFAKLRHLLDFCRKQHIQVVLVSWPNHPAYRRVFASTAIYHPYNKELGQVVADYHVPYIDLNREPASRLDNLYADTRHLQPKGAQLFSAILANRLEVSAPQLSLR